MESYYEGELVVQQGKMLPNLQNENTSVEIFETVSATAEWLPRLQLCGSNTDLVKEGKIGMGKFALVTSANKFVELDKEIDILLVAWRAKALDLSGEDIVQTFDAKSDLFSKIKEKAGVKDSGCMYGPEFLVWIPEIKKFGTFFLGSKTARNQSDNMYAYLQAICRLRSTFIKKGGYSWHGFEVLETSETYQPPEMDEVIEQTEKFLNPPANEVEEAPETGNDRET